MAQHQWDTPEFRAWFGRSICRDRRGNPMRMYHGTPVWSQPEENRQLGDFDQFDRQAAIKAFPGRKDNADSVGSWFSDSPDGGGMFAGSNGAVYPVYLKVENPWRPRSFMEFIEQGRELAGLPIEPVRDKKTGMTPPKGRFDPAPLRAWLKKNRFDGILFDPGAVDGPDRVWVVLEPNQIKSAIGNRGSFDSNSGKIIESVDLETVISDAENFGRKQGVDITLLPVEPSTIVLDYIRGGNGTGARTITYLCQLADRHGLILELSVIDANPGLIDYYKRFGFEVTDLEYGAMTRQPRSVNEKIQQTPVNNRRTDEGNQMSLRAMIAESETEYRYTVYSPVNLHEPSMMAMIRVALGGRMARHIEPKGIVPWAGTKSDRFPSMAMKPVYSIELVTGIPLSHRIAIQELSLALNIEQDQLQITGTDTESEEELSPNGSVDCPYDKDGVTPNFLSGKPEKVPTLKDLLKDIDVEEPEEIRDVYEGFSITQIEAEMILGEDLRRGYYVVRGLGKGHIGISGPHAEVPFNYPLNLDRARELKEAKTNMVSPIGSRLVEYDLSPRDIGGGQQDPQHHTAQLASVRIQDTDTGREYPVLVTVRPGMGDDEIRNDAVQQVATKLGINPERLIALDPDRPREGA